MIIQIFEQYGHCTIFGVDLFLDVTDGELVRSTSCDIHKTCSGVGLIMMLIIRLFGRVRPWVVINTVAASHFVIW
jgi:hypothetical protein